MTYKSGSRRIIWYIIILIIGLIFSLGGGTSGSEHQDQEEGESIELKKGVEFIESRSLVTYTLAEDESIKRINRMFGLRLKKEAVLRLNKHLAKEQVEKKIPKGTELNLLIQSRISRKSSTDNSQ